MENLTASGWPRPIHDGWPVPWVSPSTELAVMHDARAAACASGAVCAVCGEGFDDDDLVYAVVKAEVLPEDLSTVFVMPMDNGILHRHCLLLSAARCPELLRLRRARVLSFVRVPANAAKVVIDEEGRPKARFDGKDCEIIADIEEIK